MSIYRIFTVKDGQVREGAIVLPYELGGGESVPAILIGEEGRGRRLGVLLVTNEAALVAQVKPPFARIALAASFTVQHLAAAAEADTTDAVIVVFAGSLGFRGGYEIALPDDAIVLCSGVIAQGQAGRMGSGTQVVALLPKGLPAIERRTGRLYGAPGVHYVTWDGDRLIARTAQQQELAGGS